MRDCSDMAVYEVLALQRYTAIQAESPTACKAGTPIQRRYRKWQKVGEFLQTQYTADHAAVKTR